MNGYKYNLLSIVNVAGFFSNVMSQIVTKLLRINLDMLTVVYVYMYMYMFQPRLSYKLLYPRFALTKD